jgi:hypothetical protein
MKEPAVSEQVNDREKEDYRKILDKVEDKLSEVTGTEKPWREKDGRKSEKKARRWFK